MKIGLVESTGRLLLMKKFPTRVQVGREALIKRIIGLTASFLNDPRCAAHPPRVIGLGAAGLIDIRKGVVEISPNFPDWQQVPLGRRLQDALGITTFLDNDANAVTFGEKWAGAGQDLQHFACLTLGTGVGGGLILGGRLWYGSHGSGPEIGHMTIKPRGERCRCGNRGCLETLASATWLVQNYKKIKNIEQIEYETAPPATRPQATLTAKDLFHLARQGEPHSLRLFKQMGEALGLALANLVHLLSLEGIILGGGLSRAATIFLPYLEKEFKKRLTLISPERVHLRISSLQEKSGVIGAAGLALERAGRRNPLN
ncbi:MAG: ROK family protein [Deltaproteobacteria bacterium]|nr:ROK family protein [Deltaproteobacteria bacterium]